MLVLAGRLTGVTAVSKEIVGDCSRLGKCSRASEAADAAGVAIR